MQKITLLLGLALIVCAVNAQLPCDSFLRVVRPELFTHCSSCFYNSWSSWTRTGRPMINSGCPTNRSFTEIRTRTDSQGKCKVEKQNRITCEPTLDEQAKLFVAALDLGSASALGTPSPRVLNATTRISRRSITAICGTPSTKICSHIYVPTRRPPIGPQGPRGPPGPPGQSGPTRRSLEEAEAEPSVELAVTNELMDDYSVPNPFDFDGHLSVITTHRNKRQAGSKKRYVLFILDSSGSIKSPHFTLMKEVLSNLLPVFCGNALFGVMSYGAKLERDICFNCDQTDRGKLWQALRSIKYHNGGSTRSGDAIRCACDYMLSRRCGYFNEPNSITDVIFLTDGHSNHGENVCSATNCIPDGVNVISIGVGNDIDYDELECIEGDNGGVSHIFDVKDLAGLKALQAAVLKFLGDNQQKCRASFNPLP